MVVGHMDDSIVVVCPEQQVPPSVARTEWEEVPRPPAVRNKRETVDCPYCVTTPSHLGQDNALDRLPDASEERGQRLARTLAEQRG